LKGFNVAIVAGLLSQIAGRIVGRKRAALIVISGLAGYTLLAGATASVVRAAIMGSRAGNLAVLFADDTTVEEQAALARTNSDLGSNVLVAPKIIEPKFAAMVNPQYAVFSSRRNSRDVPTPDFSATLAHAKIMRTGGARED
jgi:hypothetical protein